jgi:NAD(P)-dependent dehydrogenase (short-subunit alcohol dehydrogenase family)
MSTSTIPTSRNERPAAGDQMPKLDQKVAVITGGASGIGLAIAKEFEKQGASIVVFGRNEKTAEIVRENLGEESLAVQGNVTNIADLERLYDQTKESFGKIDTLIVNAGVAVFAPIEAVDEEHFDYHFDINVKGAYFTIQKALPHLNDGATIVLIASAVTQIGMANASVYSATKAALRSLARTLSAELLPRGIRVNALSPGPIETPLFEKTGLSQEEVQEFGAGLMAQHPMKRFGSSEEMAKAALFLASDDSSYVAGIELFADGGMSQL